MSSRKISFNSGEYYHVYNRGNSKQTIFHDMGDYHRFVKLIFLSNGKENFKFHLIRNDIYEFFRGEPIVDVGAYCLMPNHFHLLLTQPPAGSISKFMQKLTTSYSMYYNNKYERTGTLFEGKFKSEHINSDRYLKYLFSYIHLNPIKLIDKNWKEAGIKNKIQAIKFLKQYQFSSYHDYAGIERQQKVVLNSKVFPDYFYTAGQFKKEIFDWLNFER